MRRTLSVLAVSALSALAVGLSSTHAATQELRIGSRTEFVPDPHVAWAGSNTQFYVQYLGFLTQIGPSNELLPGLAETYRAVGPAEWEFVLRPDVVFDDGRPVTTKDVIASFERARTIPNAIGSYAGLFNGITAIVAKDDRVLQVSTSRPYPTLPNSFSQIAVLPADVAQSSRTADFGSGRASIGAGPYRFVEYIPGDRLVLARNNEFRGPRAKWSKVTFRFLTNSGTRVAALMSGDVDVIDGVPPEEVAGIRANPRLDLQSGPSDRVVFLTLDVERDRTPFITDQAGRPLDRNPLKDIRVRRAMSMSIDREAIRSRVMDDLSYPANQLGTAALGGFSKSIPALATNAAAARKLLAEAGFADGFRLTMQCPNGRLVNDAKLCQVLAQMFERIGIKTSIDLLPYSVFLPRMTNHSGERGSVFLTSWSSAYAGEVGIALQNTIHSYTAGKQLGNWNLGHYSNAEADALIGQSLAEIDRERRHDLQQRAMVIAMEDMAVIPLHSQSVVLASRKGLKARPFVNEYTVADGVESSTSP